MFTDRGGKIQMQVLPYLHVLAQANVEGSFVLPASAPANTTSIECGRLSLVPAPGDYKVLLAGFVLSIVSPDGRAGNLEMVKGKLQFRMIDGKMTNSEEKDVMLFLNEAQRLVDHASTPGPN